MFEHTAQVHKYSIPNSSTFPDADSLIPPNVFFQMTVKMDHPFVAQRVLNCAKKYKWRDDPIYFIYVVPKDHVDEYRYQIALTTKKTPLDKQPENIQQYVLGIDADSLGDD